MAIVLALLASIGFGVVDFIGGVKSRRYGVPIVVTLAHLTALVGALVLLGVLASPPPRAGDLVLSFVSGGVVILGIAAYYRGLETGAMGVVAPIVATAPLVPFTAGVLLGDQLTLAQSIGVALALVGVTTTAYQPSAGGAGGSRIALGAGLGVFAALSVGVYYVLIDLAAESAPIPWVILLHRLGILAAVALVIYPHMSGRRTASGSTQRPGVSGGDALLLVAMGAVSLGATVLLAHALNLGLLSIVGVIAALFPVTTILLAAFLLHERIRGVQRLGAAVALVGVALVAA